MRASARSRRATRLPRAGRSLASVRAPAPLSAFGGDAAPDTARMRRAGPAARSAACRNSSSSHAIGGAVSRLVQRVLPTGVTKRCPRCMRQDTWTTSVGRRRRGNRCPRGRLGTCVTRVWLTPCQRARAAQVMIREEAGAGNQ